MLQMVKCDSDPPLYACEWRLKQTAVIPASDELVKLAHQHTPYIQSHLSIRLYIRFLCFMFV